ncbi:MAG: lysylphosphatidylglycerol synthase transmembrane domain-containing protein [Acidobacteriota bacterium]|nr:lysylphosphatidylglycerol synthase transmembrane domain-containing protein [Acidobacteriota bacterium]
MSRRNVWFGLQAIGTLVLLGLLFRSFDWARFLDLLTSLSPGFYAGSLLVVLAIQLMTAIRWQMVLGALGVNVPLGEVLRQALIGMFFSNLMPTAVGGDAVKVYYLGRTAGYAEVGASVLLDRFLGFLWLAFIGSAIAWTVPADSALLQLNRNLLTLFAVLLAGFASASQLPIERVIARIMPARWRTLEARLAEFIGLLRRGALRPAPLAVSLVFALAMSRLNTELYLRYFQANGLPALPVLPVMLVIVGMAVFVNVPLSVNGIGLREQLHVLLFAGLGVPPEVAVWIALLLFSHSLVLSLVGCVLWLKVKRDVVPAIP